MRTDMSEQTTTSDQTAQPFDLTQRPAYPTLYINGFSAGTSFSDVFVLAQTAGNPSALLLMSFTTAKTLARQLGDLLSDLEKATGQNILTMDDIQEAEIKAGEEVKK
jgi:hypothetical protein